MQLQFQAGAKAPPGKGKNKTVSLAHPKKGDAKNCLGCHGWENAGMDHSVHGLVLGKREAKDKGWYCFSCHKGNPHDKDNPVTEKSCLDCHRDVNEVSHGAVRDESAWWMSAHRGAGLACTRCHDVHQQTKVAQPPLQGRKLTRRTANDLCTGCHKTRRLDFRQFSHHPVGEDGMTCTACHNPHGSPEGAPAQLHQAQGELCVSCHEDKEGPFVQEHSALNEAMGGGCTTCHDPHASAHPSLLKMSGRGLCLNCHSDRATHNPGMTCYASGCHNAVHGSNQPGFGAPLGQ